MRLLWVCLLCTPALFVKGQELDCTEPCSCCNFNGASGCGYNPAIGTDFCFDGCVDTIYSHKCKNKCSGNCLKCEKEHGTPCFACKNTYFNTSTHCSQKCSNGCNDSLCADDGSCPCLTNFVGSTCNDCLDGFFGEHCNKTCSHNCTFCDRFTGVCNECSTNTVYGEYCDVQCSQTCIDSKCMRLTGNCEKGCMPNFYGLKCDKECSENCKDGGSNLTQCDRTARCLNGCKKGFMGHTCETPCYVNCISCEHNTGVCEECSNNTMHGTYCNKTCSPNCIDNECNKDTGFCINGCIDYYRGETCEFKCSTTCKTQQSQNTCDYNGNCLNGCVDGYYNDLCDEQCVDKCLSCEQNTGYCIACKNVNVYGLFCSIPCSASCIDRECSMKSGNCTKGCITDYFGPQCERECPTTCKANNDGFEGTNCTGYENQPTKTDEVSVGLTIAAAFIGFLAGIIVCLIGSYIWKRRLKNNENDMDAQSSFPERNVSGGVTNAAVQDYEKLDNEQRRTGQEQTAYELLETSTAQQDRNARILEQI